MQKSRFRVFLPIGSKYGPELPVNLHGSFHPEPGCIAGSARLVAMAAAVHFCERETTGYEARERQEDRIGTAPPRARAEVICIDLAMSLSDPLASR